MVTCQDHTLARWTRGSLRNRGAVPSLCQSSSCQKCFEITFWMLFLAANLSIGLLAFESQSEQFKKTKHWGETKTTVSPWCAPGGWGEAPAVPWLPGNAITHLSRFRGMEAGDLESGNRLSMTRQSWWLYDRPSPQDRYLLDFHPDPPTIWVDWLDPLKTEMKLSAHSSEPKVFFESSSWYWTFTQLWAPYSG